jgi:hypothetical protein
MPATEENVARLRVLVASPRGAIINPADIQIDGMRRNPLMDI